ncbi:hypothetical protein FOA52_008062 [Chlamydomonas sp. UWO 241]|nr:hypothetical protein FOA52_008062 [Chlamydomonas sp. UWO 241]
MTTSLSPISALNQAWQLGICAQPTFEAGEATGQPPNQKFECTCVITTVGGHDRRVLRGIGSGRSKGAAKTACASLVLDELRGMLTPAQQAAFMGAVPTSSAPAAALPAAALPAGNGAVNRHATSNGNPRSPALSARAVSAAVSTVLTDLGLASEVAAALAAAVMQTLGVPSAGSSVPTTVDVSRDELELAAAAAATNASTSTEVKAVRELLAGPMGMGRLVARIAGPMTVLTSVSVPVYSAAGGGAAKLVTAVVGA